MNKQGKKSQSDTKIDPKPAHSLRKRHLLSTVTVNMEDKQPFNKKKVISET